MLKLLDTTGGNTKLRKTTKGSSGFARVAGLSMHPDDTVCPFRWIAGCGKGCLVGAGRGVMRPVKESRLRKLAWFHEDKSAFLNQLRKEIRSFEKVCAKAGVQPVVRLNVITDVQWEKLGIPQEFPEVYFYDYTKIASRLVRPLPENYDLLFSYSSKPEYQRSVKKALSTERPIAVVFNGPFPERFLGRPVFDGDKSDLENVKLKNAVIALTAKGPAKQDQDGFVVHT